MTVVSSLTDLSFSKVVTDVATNAESLPRGSFQETLAQSVLVCDGAMGTELLAHGATLDQCLDALNIQAAHLVEAIHRAYIRAGAQIVETNTFGANRLRLASYGLAGQSYTINRAGARLARNIAEAVGEPVFIAGAIGPLGVPPHSLHDGALAAYGGPRAIFADQVEGLLAGGVDLLILETFSDLDEMSEAVLAARAVCSLPIIAQMTFTEDEMTPANQTPEEVVATLESLGVAVAGINCSVGPQSALRIVERMAAVSRIPLAAQPNAGLPSRVGGRIVYLATPDYMARYGVEMVHAGARVVGGCCGTTPDYIRALRQSLDQQNPQGPDPRRSLAIPIAAHPVEPEPAEAELAGERSSHFVTRLLARQFVTSVEMRPPRGATPTKMLAGASLLRDCGVDAVNVVDSARAIVRMSTLAAAYLVRQHVGLETILHMTTRDRNVMGLQGDLIGAYALGARVVLALTGDPPNIGGAYGQAKGVYDVDSIGLIKIIRGLNRGEDVVGKTIGKPTCFVVGCALNPVAEDLDWELDRFHQKIEAGAQFVMTQPIYDVDQFQRVLDRLGPIPVPVLLGILPLHSYRHAEFLRNEVPGVAPTLETLERMRRAGADGIIEGATIAREILTACQTLVQGVYIMPSFDRYDVAGQLITQIIGD